MRTLLLSGMVLVFLSTSMARPETASVRLFCLSLRFQPATASFFGLTYRLDIGFGPGAAGGLDGELAPTFDSGLPTHASGFVLSDPVLIESTPGDLAMDVPFGSDQNGNGFPDFFESSQAVPSTTTSGLFATGFDGGSVTAVWSRPAGSATGTCRLTLESDTFGRLPELAAVFELIEFTGTLNYTNGAAGVQGVVQLARTGSPEQTLTGPVVLTRSSTAPFDDLAIAAGTWTNSAGESLELLASRIERDATLKTNYYGFLDFADFDLATAQADYLTWQLSIDDPNDADGDDIPDLSDDPVGGTAPRPLVSLARAEDKLLLEINGSQGKTYVIERTPSMTSPVWTNAISITLTNPIQTLELSAPESGASFWRAKEL